MAVQPVVVRWIVSLAVMLPLTRSARAVHPHEFHNCDVWHRHLETVRAEQHLYDTEEALRQAELDVDAAGASRDRAAADERRLSDDLAAAYSEIDRLRVELSRAETDLKRLEDNAKRTAGVAERIRRDVEDLRPKVEAARKAIDDAVAEAVAAFEAGEPMQSAAAHLRGAEVELNRSELACVESLSQTDEFRRAKEEADQLEAKRNALRDQKPRDDDAVGTASKAWIDAKRRVKDLIEAAKDADPAVITARADVNAAKDAIADLQKQFERSLPQNTKVAEAQKAFDAVNEPYENAVQEFEAADAKALAAQQALDARAATALSLRTDLAKAENDVERFDGALDDIRTAISTAEDQLAGALAHLDRVRADRESAVIELRHAEGVESIAACSFVIIRDPFFDGGHHHHHHDHDRDHDHDGHHDHDRDRDHDRSRGDDDRDRDGTRRPRLDGQPVGRPRRPGGAEFVDGAKPTTQPAGGGGGSAVASPAPRAPRIADRDVSGRQSAIDSRAPNDVAERRRLIAERAAQRDRERQVEQQRRQQAQSPRQTSAAVVEPPRQPVVVPSQSVAARERETQVRQQREREAAERKAAEDRTALGARQAAAERERQASAKQAAVVAERQQQREQNRAADLAREQTRRAERAEAANAARQRESQRDAQRQQERDARQAADRQRASERAAERNEQRQQVQQRQEQRRESASAKSGNDGEQRRSRR